MAEVKLIFIDGHDCWRCSGTGNNFVGHGSSRPLGPGVCSACRGWKHQLTSDGDALAAFLHERYSLEMKDGKPMHTPPEATAKEPSDA